MRQLGRIPALDGLRAIAIAAVIAIHGWGFGGGELGVDLFLVLSGFLITALLLGKWARDGKVSLRAFYRRRSVRIVPALTLLVVAYAIYTLVVEHETRHGLVASAVALTYTTDIASRTDPSLFSQHLSHLWSLALEEQFYLLWPPLLIVALRRRLNPRWIAAFLATGLTLEAVMTGWRNPIALYLPDQRACSVLFGCLAAVLWTARLIPRVPGWLAVAAVFAAVPARELFLTQPHYSILLFAGCATLLILYLADAPKGRGVRVLTAKPLATTGRVSYGIYLWHLPLFGLFGPYVGLPATALAVAGSWRYVERPLTRYRTAKVAAPRASEQRTSSALPPTPVKAVA
jgi:peptidoglycan/LPS O-acetylase OafA/YrhL